MASAATLLVKVVTDVKDAQKGMKDAEGSVSKFGSGLNKASLVATAGLAAIGGVMIAGAKSAAEDAQAQAILATALKNSAGASDAQVASTEDWISAQGRATGITDDELRPALGALVRATGDVTKAQAAARLAMDISTATGKDLQSVSEALAKAYGGNTASLGKLVPGIDKATLASKDMNAITAELTAQVGGSAAAAAGTAAGQYQIFKTQIAETKEGIGAALLPVLGKLTGLMAQVSSWAGKNTGALTVLLGVFAALFGIIVTVNAVTKAWTAIQAVVKAATLAWAVAQRVLNLALLSNPIGLVIIAVVALVAVFVLAWKNSETFRRIVTGAFQGVLAVVQAVWAWIKNNWPLLLAILLGPFGIAVAVIVRNFDTIKAAAESVFNFLKGIFDKIASAVKTVSGLISKIPKTPKIDLNPFGASAPSTAVTGARFAGVARAPAARATGTGGTFNVTINSAIDPEGTARALARVFTQHGIRMGHTSALSTAGAI